MRVERCPVLGSWPEEPTQPCGAKLYTRETVDKIAPSVWWEISDEGEINDWEDQYAPVEQEGEGLAFYCERQHSALQIVAAAVGV